MLQIYTENGLSGIFGITIQQTDKNSRAPGEGESMKGKHVSQRPGLVMWKMVGIIARPHQAGRCKWLSPEHQGDNKENGVAEVRCVWVGGKIL